jgi:hypothetical protein
MIEVGKKYKCIDDNRLIFSKKEDIIKVLSIDTFYIHYTNKRTNRIDSVPKYSFYKHFRKINILSDKIKTLRILKENENKS